MLVVARLSSKAKRNADKVQILIFHQMHQKNHLTATISILAKKKVINRDLISHTNAYHSWKIIIM